MSLLEKPLDEEKLARVAWRVLCVAAPLVCALLFYLFTRS